ncbi:MAG: thrombospondin type 3 repeat-containing protein [Deltaproteobacteria bacterium]|nr:thrombospondin type 3 repeat-containing protein [Deltaproteobacteria bacterium]
MDYVPQEIGIYDSWYDRLEEIECRRCHGDSLADRHHHTPIVLEQGFCHPCHESTPEPPGVVVITDCKTSGCHSGDDLRANGWHHDTDLFGAENCVKCHDRNLVSEILPFSGFAEYPPSVETPELFSCQNCHWEQDVVGAVAGFDPNTSPPSDAGHPSTYHHYDESGQFTGYLEYGADVASNFLTHHMGFKGYALTGCWTCHSTHPNDQSWDPADPENIRYCETCHDINALHTIEAHTGPSGGDGGHAGYGWVAVGFYASDPSEIPGEYRSFDATEQCRGCHGENPPIRRPDVLAEQPSIDSVNPTSGNWGSHVLLMGDHFGSEQNLERGVQLKLEDDPDASWLQVPVRSWSNMEIEWELPHWTFSPGNYSLRVYTEFGASSQPVFTVIDEPSFIDASPDSGPCGTWISVSGSGGFGDLQSEVYADGYHGVRHVVDFVSPTGTYTAKQYQNWSDTSLDVWIRNMFIDENDVCTGQRNFVQDDAKQVPCIVDGFPGSSPCDNDCAAYTCSDEPKMTGCESMDIGTYSVHVRAIHFGDEDRSGDLSCGDTIFHVATSDAISFELAPYINEVTPKEIERGNLLTIIGKGFGLQQGGGAVHIGSKKMAKAPALNKGWVLTGINAWSDTQVQVWLDLPPNWENRTKYVWIEKDGMKTNFQWITILEPDGDDVFGNADNCPDTPNPDQSDTDDDGLGDACDCWGDPETDPDGDGVCAGEDNCPEAANPNQGDADGDGQGNACDVCPNDPANDVDSDGLCVDTDNCPDISNADQADADGDGTGDVCDACPNDPANDADGDSLCGGVDNCPDVFNAGQRDSDNDGLGNKCDPCPYDFANDVDSDGLCADADNCPETYNPDQGDVDGDGTGDVCDACPNDPANDADGDGVCGDVDNCPDTSNLDQSDVDADGTGDLCDTCPNDPANDADGDGVCGDVDNCPATPNADQGDSNGSGNGDACEPIADAGSDLTIISEDQAITALQGAASDPNDDPCTFRWVEGETELSTWQAAGENGACYLDLNTVPSFSSGDHTLTLEVDDGADTASDNMVITVFPNPEIQLIGASVTGGFGGNGVHFYVGDTATFNIDYEITGGDPQARYEVTGVAVPQYPYCTNNKRRARTVEYVGPGTHPILFQKAVPACADDPNHGPSGWTDVKWRVDLRTEDGITLHDRDSLTMDEAIVIDGS